MTHRPERSSRRRIAATAWTMAALWIAAQCSHAGPSSARSPAGEIAWIWRGETLVPAGFDEAAVLMEDIVLKEADVERTPRTRPLGIPGRMRLTPVIHVQAQANARTTLSASQRGAILAAIERHAPAASSGWVQLDFEAPARMRASYVALVGELRASLPRNLRLSVTVLAAWCAQGSWLSDLRADEIVPMLYRLGPDAAAWRLRWLDPAARLETRCRAGAAGFSVQERPSTGLLSGTTRRYWFNERNWSRDFQPPLR